MAITINGNGTLSGVTSGVGSILQVKQSVMTGITSTISSSFVFPSDLTLSITPSSTSSKILVDCNIWVASNRWMSHITLQRNGTDLGLADAASNRARWFLNWMMDNTVQNTHGTSQMFVGSY